MDIVLGNDLKFDKHNKSIFGMFYIDIDGFCFPDNEWTDFAYPVLDWWVSEFIKTYKSKEPMQLIFMDGDYSINAKYLKNCIQLALYDDDPKIGNLLEVKSCSITSYKECLLKGLVICRDIFIENKDKQYIKKCDKQIKILTNITN